MVTTRLPGPLNVRPPASIDMSTSPGTRIEVLAHRGWLNGRDPEHENLVASLRHAAAAGFGVEFDVRRDVSGQLVLSHDPVPWSPERDALSFLTDPPGDHLHALNVKDPAAVILTLDVLERAGTTDRFMFFDFELACADAGAAAALAATAARRGARVARRLSDREPVLADIVADTDCRHVWLDEFDGPWADRECLARLRSAGKFVWYVSPELHRPAPVTDLIPRWQQLLAWGARGVCTDYPVAFAAHLRTAHPRRDS